MTTMHAKSNCCQAKVYRRGDRRRSCSQCGRTWRIRAHKRGRKRRRVAKRLLQRVLGAAQSLCSAAQQRGQSLPAVRYRFRQALLACAAQPAAYALPRGPLILLADALWFTFGKRKWTLYLLAVRPAHGSVATFLDPVLLAGRECAVGWQQALATVPQALQKRVHAFVCDGFRGGKGMARRRGWVFQRCHFHLIAALQGVRGTRKRLPGREVREAIYALVREALKPQKPRHQRCLEENLRALAASLDCPKRMRMIVRDFLREIDSFHAYLHHPELNLPTTTNALESMASLMRATVRTVRTPQALERWGKAFVRVRPHITCNGTHFAPN
jgi:hypothetical protein